MVAVTPLVIVVENYRKVVWLELGCTIWIDHLLCWGVPIIFIIFGQWANQILSLKKKLKF
jgi:hypothetical protein